MNWESHGVIGSDGVCLVCGSRDRDKLCNAELVEQLHALHADLATARRRREEAEGLRDIATARLREFDNLIEAEKAAHEATKRELQEMMDAHGNAVSNMFLAQSERDEARRERDAYKEANEALQANDCDNDLLRAERDALAAKAEQLLKDCVAGEDHHMEHHAREARLEAELVKVRRKTLGEAQAWLRLTFGGYIADAMERALSAAPKEDGT